MQRDSIKSGSPDYELARRPSIPSHANTASDIAGFRDSARAIAQRFSDSCRCSALCAYRPGDDQQSHSPQGRTDLLRRVVGSAVCLVMGTVPERTTHPPAAKDLSSGWQNGDRTEILNCQRDADAEIIMFP